MVQVISKDLYTSRNVNKCLLYSYRNNKKKIERKGGESGEIHLLTNLVSVNRDQI